MFDSITDRYLCARLDMTKTNKKKQYYLNGHMNNQNISLSAWRMKKRSLFSLAEWVHSGLNTLRCVSINWIVLYKLNNWTFKISYSLGWFERNTTGPSSHHCNLWGCWCLTFNGQRKQGSSSFPATAACWDALWLWVFKCAHTCVWNNARICLIMWSHGIVHRYTHIPINMCAIYFRYLDV